MTINPDALLYAVGVGAGTSEPAFTTENTSGLEQRVLPTFAMWVDGEECLFRALR